MLRNRILYTIVFLSAALCAFFLGVGYVLIYALAALVAVSFLLARFAPFLARINEYIDKTEVHKNEYIIYSASVPQRARLIYPRIRYAYFGAGRVNYDETEQGEYRLSFPYRGRYPVGVSRMYVTDCLGLFTPGFPQKKPIYVTVFPRRLDGFALPKQNELISGESAGIDLSSEHTADRFDVRKYAYGDDYRKIHWKLTAKKNELIVKDYNASLLNKTLIFLDTAKLPADVPNALKTEDDMASIAVSAAFYCLQNRLPAAVFFGEDCIDVQTHADYDMLLRLMAEARFSADDYLSDILKQYAQDDNLCNMALVVYAINDGLFTRACELSQLGHNIVIYTLNEAAKDEQERFAALAAAGVFCQNAAAAGLV